LELFHKQQKIMNSLEQIDAAQISLLQKEEKLGLCYKELEKYGDGIEPKIKDTIAYLNALGFTTCESCEGHVDHGDLSTYIGMEATEPPKWRFVGQEEVFEGVAKKHGVTVSEIFEYVKPGYDLTLGPKIQPGNVDQIVSAWEDGWGKTPRETETDEFKKWREKTDEMKDKLDLLVQEFYKERTADSDVKLVVETENDPEFPHVYDFFLHNGGEDYGNHCDPDERAKLSEGEMNVLKKRLETRQNEMKDFTEFLKEKYKEYLP